MGTPSPRFTQLQLDLWREACAHIALEESTEAIARCLSEHVPLHRLFIRRIEPARGCVETLTVGPVGASLPEAQSELPGQMLPAILAWCRQRRVERLVPGRKPPPHLACLLPRGISGEVLLSPLPSMEEHVGLFILEAAEDQRFRLIHLRIAQSLIEPLTAALRNYEHLRELAQLREAAEAERQSLLTRLGREKLADTIVGAQSGLRFVMERVELVARSDVPVLLLGETGTGKELIARTIHQGSSRRDRPFVRVNCGAIPPELIDSQLFGHERGAFTGAVESHKGWFERADGGTLLLDEIGELPPAAQVRLLRILQDGWLERVGGHQPIHVDVRMVASTHRDLAAMVAQGRFREDLWYRIAVFPIFLPPLRDRRGDIGPLARHFAQRAAIRFGLPQVMPTEEDIALLQSYAWPGNVRELASVIDRAAILGEGRCLEVARALGMNPSTASAPIFPLEAPLSSAPNLGSPSINPGSVSDKLGDSVGLEAPNAGAGLSGFPGAELPEPPAHSTRPTPDKPLAPLDEAVRAHIEKALTVCKGRIEGPFGAAALLKINPHTLRARMRKLGIPWRRFRPGSS